MAVSKKVEETPIIPEVPDQLPKELIRVFQQYGIRLNNALLRDGSEEMEGDLVLVDQDPTEDRHAAYKKYVDAAVAAGGLASGVRLFFDQDSAPTGWTRDTTINDKVLRVVSGSRVDGGTWTISGLTPTIASHILSIAQMPVHNHTYNRPNVSPSGLIGAVSDVRSATGGIATGNAGGGAGHGHPGSTVASAGTWRPLHRDVIVASKN